MVLPVPMRASPTATMNGTLHCYNGASVGICTGVAVSYCGATTMEVDLNLQSNSSFGAGQFVLCYQNNDNASIDLSAEL